MIMNSKIFGIFIQLALEIILINSEPIVNGKGVYDISRYPYIVSIRFLGEENQCAGTIIDNRHILTAAHCLKHAKSKEKLDIIAGDSNQLSDEVKHLKVEKMKFHSRYRSKVDGSELYVFNDIGLIRVTEDIEFSEKINKISLPETDILKPGKNVILLGWGLTDDGDSLPDRLQRLLTKIFSTKDCSEVYPGLSDAQFCTFTQSTGMCNGDSGGPVIFSKGNAATDVLVGIISHNSLPCGSHPDVHTNVYHYLKWIEDAKNEVN